MEHNTEKTVAELGEIIEETNVVSETIEEQTHEPAEVPCAPSYSCPSPQSYAAPHESYDSRDNTQLDHIELGKRGEHAARAFLERHGFDILNTNWVCPAGEVDIVVWDGYALRFIEVKTRRGTGKGFPEEAVDEEKRRRYECIAEYYLRSFNKPEDTRVFFDIIGIVTTGPNSAFLRYHRDAFGRDYER